MDFGVESVLRDFVSFAINYNVPIFDFPSPVNVHPSKKFPG